MALHFLLGGSGSGKSSELISEIVEQALANPDKNYLLLVPEQFCLSAQRLLILRHPRHALINIEALSFDRLAARAFREFGVDPTRIVSDITKKMILALAIRDVLPDLTVYGRQALRPAFAARLGSLFAEWEMNGIDPVSLAEKAKEDGVPQLLQQKLADLTCLFASYQKRLGNRLTAEEKLPYFLKLLPGSSIGRVETLYLDGFTGFTGVQYRILEILMGRARNTRIALTLPEKEDPDAWFKAEGRQRDELYAMSQETIWRLKRIAERLGLKSEIEQYAYKAPPRPAELAFLSETLMQPSPALWEEVPQRIKLFASDSPEEEAEWAAARIRELAQKGLRYRDIAVIVSDPEIYVPRLEKVLKEAEIPCFTDRREPLSGHPLIGLIEDAWESVSSRDRDAFLRYVKNPLGPLQREESDILENYLLSAGIRGGKRLEETYTKPPARRPGEKKEDWSLRAENELAALNALREKALAPLAALREMLSRGRFAAADIARELLKLLNDPAIPEVLSLQAALLREAGQEAKAQVWEEAPEAITEFLSSVEQLFGEQKVSRAEMTDMLKTGLSALSVGKLPQSSDQLVIGEPERSRFGAIRHLIFLGMNADLLPKPRSGGGLLTDEERRLLASEEAAAYTDERALFEERFYLHNLLSLPRESMDLSFSRMDSSRKARQPASLISDVRRIFPLLREQAGGVADPRRLSFRAAALRALAIHFREGSPAWASLYTLLREEEDAGVKTALDRIERGSGYRFEPARLSADTARALFGENLIGSVTRLESFAACPYKHFLRYGLLLNERDEYKWESRDHGTFFHLVMETLLKGLTKDGVRIAELSEEDCRKRIHEALAAAEAGNPDFAENINAPYLLSRWERSFMRYLKVMGRWEEENGFRPHAFELHFGPDPTSALTIPLKDKGELRLQGTIDRLDLYEDQGRTYLRIIDYKTGNKKLDFGEMTLGTQLQLGAYRTAALRILRQKEPGRTILPGGLYYAILKENWLREWKKTEDREEAAEKNFRLSGLTAGEVLSVSSDTDSGGSRAFSPGSSGLELLGRGICRTMKELGEEILAGKIEASPVESGDERLHCDFCPYTELCDENFTTREVPKLTAEAYLQAEKEAEDGIH